MVVPWNGVELADVLAKVGVQSAAKYVAFETTVQPDVMIGVQRRVIPFPYVEGLRLDEAMHPLTLLATGIYGEPMPNQNGAPIRLVVPWKYGFKSIKSIVRMTLTEEEPPASWNIINPGEYGFYSNVNPTVDHPRWSQASERRIGGGLFAERVDTLMFNGYEAEVASLYEGMDLAQAVHRHLAPPVPAGDRAHRVLLCRLPPPRLAPARYPRPRADLAGHRQAPLHHHWNGGVPSPRAAGGHVEQLVGPAAWGGGVEAGALAGVSGDDSGRGALRDGREGLADRADAVSRRDSGAPGGATPAEPPPKALLRGRVEAPKGPESGDRPVESALRGAESGLSGPASLTSAGARLCPGARQPQDFAQESGTSKKMSCSRKKPLAEGGRSP
jgi:hypothetical protein